MSPVLPLTAGSFAAGLALGSYLPYLPLSVLLLLLGLGAVLTALERAERLETRVGLLVYGAVLVGLVVWTWAAGAGAGARAAGRAAAEPVAIRGTVVEPVRHAPGRLTAVVSVTPSESGEDPAEGRLRLTWRDPDRRLAHGDRLAVTARLHEPAFPVNPGGLDFESVLARRGIGTLASVSGPGQVMVSPPEGLYWRAWALIDGWRDRIRAAAARSLDGPALGVFLGIVIGESGYLTPEVRDRFMATGTVHILSISGSHLGLIALLSFFVVKQAVRRLPAAWLLALSRHITATRLAAGLTVVPVTLYAVLAGAEVATVRALIMILLFLLAVWLGREHRLTTAVAVAAVLILTHQPTALYDISFQLSFASVLAIALVWERREARPGEEGRPAPGPARRLRRWLGDYALVTGAVTIATLPLTACYFNQVAWLGLLANLLVVPFVGLLLVPLGLCSALWLLTAGGDSLPAAPLNQALLKLLDGAVARLAAVPGAEWHVASPSPPAVGAFYLLIAAAVLRGAGRRLRAGCGLAALFLLVWWIWSPRPPFEEGRLRVTFLDVGQGDATVIELPDGQTVLIDGGAAYDTLDMGRAVVSPFLWDRGIRRLDHVIGTHPQLDHVGGLASILEKFPVGTYWSNGADRDEAFYLRLKDVLARRGIPERIVQAGDRLLDVRACRLDALNPPADGGKAAGGAVRVEAKTMSGTALNNLSVVVRLDCGPHAFLFPGDVEVEALARMRREGRSQKTAVVKVPHHGARSSLDSQWLRQLDPDVAVVSVGRRNPYGHPAPAVLDVYRELGIPLHRTDVEGAVSISVSAGSGVHVRGARASRPQSVVVDRRLPAREWDNLGRLWRVWTET